MPFTFGKLKQIVAPYAGMAGKCASSADTEMFARGVMEYLLMEGSTAAIRELKIFAYNGTVVLPPEVEVPLKVKINGRPSEIWNKWCTISNPSSNFDGHDCYTAWDVLAENGDYSPIAYPLPPAGSRIGVMATCEEDSNDRVIVSGLDVTGREIYSENSQGERVVGEEFRLVKNEIRYSQFIYGKVTGVIKPITNGYVQLFAYDPQTDARTFLVDWRPSDLIPMYRKWSLTAPCGPIAHLNILFRAKLKDSYVDNELTLFDNYIAVLMAAQRLQAEMKNDLETANYKRQATGESLDNEADYKRKGNGPIQVFAPLSGGSIKNIVGRVSRMRSILGSRL